MTIQEMLERKKELGYSYEQISEYSGVPLGTVQKVLGGITQSPRYDTLRALEEVLKPQENVVREKHAYYGANPQVSYIRDGVVCYGEKHQGEYTIEDYFAWPDDQRIELIDGVIYDMATPTIPHQLIGGQIFNVLFNYIRSKKGQCIPSMSPISVQLDKDDKTMVQPDVIIVCDRDKFQEKVVYGAPDFVVEVLSPSTRRKDKTIKLTKYIEAGVREYWMVDPKKRCVVVYALQEDEEDYDIAVYTFDDEVPVALFQGECKVDFKEICDYISFLY